MLHKVRGIVIKVSTYSESSVVAQIFTDKFGIQSYLINGVKKPKAKISINILQPLHLLDMVVYHKANTQLQRVAEARAVPIFKSIPYDVIKNTIVQFLNEVLYKCIQHQGADDRMFEFIFNAISWFDEVERTSVNFHLSFLLKLTRFLGFAPHTQQRPDQKFFDLQEGEFTSIVPLHPYYLDLPDAEMLISLFQTKFDDLQNVQMNNVMRRRMLDKVLIYYNLHTASFGQVKSHHVLEEVLS